MKRRREEEEVKKNTLGYDRFYLIRTRENHRAALLLVNSRRQGRIPVVQIQRGGAPLPFIAIHC